MIFLAEAKMSDSHGPTEEGGRTRAIMNPSRPRPVNRESCSGGGGIDTPAATEKFAQEDHLILLIALSYAGTGDLTAAALNRFGRACCVLRRFQNTSSYKLGDELEFV